MVIVEGKNNTSSRCSGSGNSKLLSIMILRFVYFVDGTEKNYKVLMASPKQPVNGCWVPHVHVQKQN